MSDRRRSAIRHLMLVILFVVAAAVSASAGSFAELQLEPRADPEGFENARRYEIIYLASESGSLEETDPPLSAKLEEMDFILAGIVREYLKREYEGNGLKADVRQILPTTASEVIELVSGEFSAGTSKWDPANQKTLAAYLGNCVSALRLYKLHAIVNLAGHPVERTVPVIIRLKACPAQRDLVTLFHVNTRALQE